MDVEARRSIQKKVSELKKSKKDYFDANIFLVPENITRVEESENGIVYIFTDKGVERVYFAANDPEALRELLEKMPEGSGIEIVSDHVDPVTKEAINKAGFRDFESYVRASVTDLKNNIYANIPDKFKDVDCSQWFRQGAPEDAPAIYEILYDTFSPFTSHLQSMEELMQEIENGTVVVAPKEGPIEGFITYLYQGKKLYIEQTVNRGESIYMHSMYLSVLEKAIEDGINLAYTWVREDNPQSNGLIRRYGYKHEKVKNFAFLKENEE